MRRLSISALFSFSICLLSAEPLVEVSTNIDSGEGSLRQALLDVDQGGVITFSPSMSGETITLTSAELEISSEVTIDASALGSGIEINAGELRRVVNFLAGANATIHNITFSGAREGGGIVIFDDAFAQLENCALLNNDSNSTGGGAYVRSGAQLVLVDCLIEGNLGDKGGGVYNFGIFTARGCTFRGNEAREDGGGFYNRGTEFIENCLFVQNTAQSEGGGMWLRRDTTLLGCTITENEAPRGGGIFSTENLDLKHCTIVGNTASRDYGAFFVGERFRIWSSIISDNDQVSELTGISDLLISESVNSYFEASAPLDPLDDYGGPTLTLRPTLGGTGLIDLGETSPAALLDARGQARVVGDASDIGAVEYLGEIEEELLIRPYEDPDGDGDITLFEVVTGRDPFTADWNTARHLGIRRNETGHEVSFGFDPEYADRVELTLYSTDGVEGLEVLLTNEEIESLPLVDGIKALDMVVDVRVRFYRLDMIAR